MTRVRKQAQAELFPQLSTLFGEIQDSRTLDLLKINGFSEMLTIIAHCKHMNLLFFSATPWAVKSIQFKNLKRPNFRSLVRSFTLFKNLNRNDVATNLLTV
jgi:hypothetical protein